MNDHKALNTVGLVGTGMVGASFAYALMQHGVANELVLIDKDASRAEGEMMDLNHGLPFVRPMRIIAGDYSDLVDADGVSGISISMPAIVGRRGVEEVIDLPISEAELAAFQSSAKTLKDRLAEIR